MQAMSDTWKAKIVKKHKPKLNFSKTCCSKTKRAVQESIHPRTREPMHVWDSNQRLVAQPEAVGKVFPECLFSLAGDPLYEVDEDTLASHSRVPRCPLDVASQRLPSQTTDWLTEITSAANPFKAKGEDDLS